ISLMSLDIKPDDIVITTPYSFFATAGVIVRLGAKPVFVDIEPNTYNLDPDKLEEVLKKQPKYKSKCIIPVHLYGQCADMDRISAQARKYNVKIIEDAAQSIGAKDKEKSSGTMGDMGCFSFFPSKNLGCFGDGGMVITNNENLAEKIKILRVHGSKPKYYHSLVGGNFRLDALQAAVLIVKLKYLADWTKKRQQNASTYNQLFEKNKLVGLVRVPFVSPENFHIYNQYIIRVQRRDELLKFLKEQDIGTEIYYPVPFHLQPCFSPLGYREGDFPEAEKASKETMAIPIYPELTVEQQEYVVMKIKEFYNR
ncbi:MAG: transcriptional regulator, partial [Elusimicrobia bacterium CG02_land_8_20_14_3_00_37_13]